MDTSKQNEPSFWRPWQNNDEVTVTDQGLASPARKRIRVYYSDEQRQDMARIYDPQVKAIIKKHLTGNFEAKKTQIQEDLRKRTGVRRRQMNTSYHPARHAIPALLTRSLTTTLPTTRQSAVTKTTSHLTTGTTTHVTRDVSPVNRPYQVFEESLSLDSIIMVPFLRIKGDTEKDCASDNDYRYVSAAKFLGFYRITDDRSG